MSEGHKGREQGVGVRVNWLTMDFGDGLLLDFLPRFGS